MDISEHYANRGASTKDIRDFSDKINKISKELTSSENIEEFKSRLELIRSLSKKNVKEVNNLLGE